MKIVRTDPYCPELTKLGDVPFGSVVTFQAQSPLNTKVSHPYILLKPLPTSASALQRDQSASLADCETGNVVRISYDHRVEILPNAELRL